MFSLVYEIQRSVFCPNNFTSTAFLLQIKLENQFTIIIKMLVRLKEMHVLSLYSKWFYYSMSTMGFSLEKVRWVISVQKDGFERNLRRHSNRPVISKTLLYLPKAFLFLNDLPVLVEEIETEKFVTPNVSIVAIIRRNGSNSDVFFRRQSAVTSTVLFWSFIKSKMVIL